ncbi:MAG: carbohydrate kinase family protein [Halobacteriaceae archaeon]
MTDRAPTIVGVGNALVDHTFFLTNLPQADGGAFVLDYERRFGGVETNVVTLTAALGHDGGVVSRVGSDEEGDAVIDHLDAYDIDATHVTQAAGETTSYTLVLTDPDGQRAIVGGGDTILNLVLDDAATAYVADADIAFSSAYAPVSAVETVAELDVPLVYDLAGRFQDLEHRGLTRDALDALLPDIDCLIANEAAARSFTQVDADRHDLAAGLRARGCPRGAVTAGADGAVLFDADGTYHSPAIDVDPVDTTGAGDAFTAGLIHAWLLGDADPREAGRFATATAAATCLVEGAHTDPPTLADVEAILE